MYVNCLFETHMALLPQEKFKNISSLYAKRVYGSLCDRIWVRTTHLPPDWREVLKEARLQDTMTRKGILYRALAWLVSTCWVSDSMCDKFRNWVAQPDPFPGMIYECSWVYAAVLVASFRGLGDNIQDLYNSGVEGRVDEEFEADMHQFGWQSFTDQEIFGSNGY